MSLLNRLMLKRLGVVPTHKVTVQRNVKVPTTDGAELATDLYLGNPHGAPVVMVRSPYGRGASGGAIYALASQGLNVLIQSCRGTFGSTGTFDPHHDERRDGLATIEWIKQQPWYGGALATFGMSYLGYTQWSIAKAAGPELKAMAMQVTLSDFAQMTYAGNSLMLENAWTWTHMMSAMKKGLLGFIVKRLLGKMTLSDAQWKTLPLKHLDEKIIGEPVNFWQDWMRHDSVDDPWWSPMSFRGSVDTIQRPISMVAGWYDIFLPWQMRDYVDLQKAGGETRLTIGPWVHADRALMNASALDAIDWFKRHLLHDKTLSPQPKPVKLYVIGADEWRYFDAWPPRESIPQAWYLQPQKNLRTEISPESNADSYRYDPADPTPSIGGPALEVAPYSVDNTALELRSDVVTYTSEPFAKAADIIGAVSADLYVSSTAPSADFFVRLCDVDVNGISKNICDGLQRVSIEAVNSPQRVHVELWPTAYRIAPGHRLRVQISSGAFPRWARNLGSTDPIATATELRCAIQSIHHSPTYPSAITLPFCN